VGHRLDRQGIGQIHRRRLDAMGNACSARYPVCRSQPPCRPIPELQYRFARSGTAPLGRRRALRSVGRQPTNSAGRQRSSTWDYPAPIAHRARPARRPYQCPGFEIATSTWLRERSGLNDLLGPDVEMGLSWVRLNLREQESDELETLHYEAASSNDARQRRNQPDGREC